MFKTGLCSLLLAASFSAHALDEISAIPDAHQKVLTTITNELGLKNIDKSVQREIYGAIQFALDDDWYSYWVGNSDLAKSKFQDDKVKIVDLIIPNNDRINSITFTYFPAARQIFYAQRQFVEGSSEVGMEAYRKAQANSEMKKLNEENNYAILKKDGYVQFEIYHVKGSNALASYIDYGIIDIK